MNPLRRQKKPHIIIVKDEKFKDEIPSSPIDWTPYEELFLKQEDIRGFHPSYMNETANKILEQSGIKVKTKEDTKYENKIEEQEPLKQTKKSAFS